MNNFLAKLFFLALLGCAILGAHTMYKSIDSSKISRLTKTSDSNHAVSQVHFPDGLPQSHQGELIQIALLLDVSGSMSGLIDQARSELWKVVNELAGRNEEKSRLEIALYSYGVGSQPKTIYKISDFTTDLDYVSEKLYGLQITGSDEWCGQVIHDAVTELEWRRGKSGGRFICIAGNEPFTQGSFPYEKACNMAAQKGIVVNTIFCGERNAGLISGWKDGAQVGGGEFFAINHNQVTDIASPYDKDISSVNQKLNGTYMNYSASGDMNFKRQQVQDGNAQKKFGSANVATRAKSKLSAYYKNDHWDLVDAVDNEKIDLDTITVSAGWLAPALQDKSREEIKEEVEELRGQRSSYQSELKTLIARRDSFVNTQRKAENAPSSLGEALTTSFKKKLK